MGDKHFKSVEWYVINLFFSYWYLSINNILIYQYFNITVFLLVYQSKMNTKPKRRWFYSTILRHYPISVLLSSSSISFNGTNSTLMGLGLAGLKSRDIDASGLGASRGGCIFLQRVLIRRAGIIPPHGPSPSPLWCKRSHLHQSVAGHMKQEGLVFSIKNKHKHADLPGFPPWLTKAGLGTPLGPIQSGLMLVHIATGQTLFSFLLKPKLDPILIGQKLDPIVTGLPLCPFLSGQSLGPFPCGPSLSPVSPRPTSGHVPIRMMLIPVSTTPPHWPCSVCSATWSAQTRVRLCPTWATTCPFASLHPYSKHPTCE